MNLVSYYKNFHFDPLESVGGGWDFSYVGKRMKFAPHGFWGSLINNPVSRFKFFHFHPLGGGHGGEYSGLKGEGRVDCRKMKAGE